jgi:hypothetical protein
MAPYTFLQNIESEVPIPENGILSRTLFNDEALKGEAELTLGAEKKNVRAGAFWPRTR